MNKIKSKEFLYPIDRDWLMGDPNFYKFFSSGRILAYYKINFSNMFYKNLFNFEINPLQIYQYHRSRRSSFL